jgi:hypothetical protein
MRMRRKVEARPRVEAFDPSRFEGGGDLIEGDFTVRVVDTRPTPSPLMQERSGNRRTPEEAVKETKNRARFKKPMILLGSVAAVFGVVVAALLFDGGRQGSVGAQSSAASKLAAVGAASATPLVPERLVAAGEASVKRGQSERILERFVQWRLKGRRR